MKYLFDGKYDDLKRCACTRFKKTFSFIILLNVACALFRLNATGLREPFGDSPYMTLFHEIYTF